MHQVAQYWNECIQIAEEEKGQASLEIEGLQRDLDLHRRKLADCRSMLDNKVNKLHDIEDSHRQLQENDAQSTTENERLTKEVEELRDQLFESKTLTKTLKEKHERIRRKLNEAIQEQQALFTRSRAFYEESKGNLQKEHERRATDAKVIEEALEKSRLKRDDMKRCLQDLRGEMERECRLSEFCSPPY